MSRHLEKINGEYKESITDMSRCRWLYDEICCNTLSYCVAESPSEEYCSLCPCYTKERDRRNGKRLSKSKVYGS